MGPDRVFFYIQIVFFYKEARRRRKFQIISLQECLNPFTEARFGKGNSPQNPKNFPPAAGYFLHRLLILLVNRMAKNRDLFYKKMFFLYFDPDRVFFI